MTKPYFILLLIMLYPFATLHAGIDPARAALIEKTSNQSKKAIEAQKKVQMLNTAGYIWNEETVRATVEYQKQFNTYLDNFKGVLTMVAETYGIYIELRNVVDNMTQLGNTLSECPENALAMALSVKRNKMYTNLMICSIDIFNDIKRLLGNNTKMTEEEIFRIINGIRPKIHRFNSQLVTLNMTMKYTSFLTVWNEITGRAYYMDKRTKKEIAERCIRDWNSNARDANNRMK